MAIASVFSLLGTNQKSTLPTDRHPSLLAAYPPCKNVGSKSSIPKSARNVFQDFPLESSEFTKDALHLLAKQPQH